ANDNSNGEGDNKKQDYTEQESTFVVASLMLGRCWQRLGRDDLATAVFDKVRQQRPDMAGLADMAAEAQSNLLLVGEIGRGPRKVTDSDGSLVGFSPTAAEAGLIPSPRVILDGRQAKMPNLGAAPIDLLEMAQQRRWQDIDTIRAVKSFAGTGMMAAGAIE